MFWRSPAHSRGEILCKRGLNLRPISSKSLGFELNYNMLNFCQLNYLSRIKHKKSRCLFVVTKIDVPHPVWSNWWIVTLWPLRLWFLRLVLVNGQRPSVIAQVRVLMIGSTQEGWVHPNRVGFLENQSSQWVYHVVLITTRLILDVA